MGSRVEKVSVVVASLDVMTVAGSLVRKHGHVGLAQQGAQVRAVVGEQCDADADGAVGL